MNSEKILLEIRPSWWNFFWHFVFCWLIVPIVVALWKRASLILRITENKVLLEKGLLSKNHKEIFISDIRTIDIKQSLFQRILGIGDVMIATAGTNGYEDKAFGIPNPNKIKGLISDQRLKGKGTND